MKLSPEHEEMERNLIRRANLKRYLLVTFRRRSLARSIIFYALAPLFLLLVVGIFAHWLFREYY